MSSVRPVEIIGGGLAGLSLGAALARAGVPVTLFEAHPLPRHRVCGEFIRGLDADTVARLGLAPVLASARRHREVRWFDRGAPLRRHRLAAPALAVSRYQLDARLADEFVRAGGTLVFSHRANASPAPGRVLASGRAPAGQSPWLGLKFHALDLPTVDGLEMHLGDRAYVGLCALADGRVNVCGLFRRRPDLVAPANELLLAYLRACGLESLAERFSRATIDRASCSAIAGLPHRPRVAASGVRLGDAFAMIPPFTGNGMAMAWQSATLALPILLAWSRGEIAWPVAEREIARRLRRRFGLRLRIAALCHGPLTSPRSQRWFVTAAHSGAVPLGLLQRALS